MDLFGGATDAVLAVVACGLGLTLLQRGGHGAGTGGVGLMLVGLAAGFGALRLTAFPELEAAHSGLSRMATMIGEPLVGAGFVTAAFVPQHARVVRSATFVTALVAAVMLVAVPLWGTIAAATGMVAVCVGAVASADPRSAASAITGAALVVVAGLVIGTDGQWAGLSRTGWFHTTLIVAHGCMAWALLRIDPTPTVQRSDELT